MKLQLLHELSKQIGRFPVESTLNVLEDTIAPSLGTEEDEEDMHFLGTDPNSVEHSRMKMTMKMLKKANPSLYHKILNFD